MSPEAIKAERIRTKRKFTQEKNKMELTINKNLDAVQLLVRKEVLEALFNDCLSINVRYVKKLESLNLTVPDYEWTDCLTDEFRAFEDKITRYVAKQSGTPSNNTPITSSGPGAAAALAAFQASSALNSTMIIAPASASLQEQEGLAQQLLERRRKLEDELNNSRLEASRKEEELKRLARQDEEEIAEQLRAAGGPTAVLPGFAVNRKRTYAASQEVPTKSLSVPLMPGYLNPSLKQLALRT